MNIGLNRQMRFEDVQEASMNNYWNERSSSYSEMNMRQFYSEQKNTWEWMIFSRVKEDRPLNVLDIGTGPGFFAILAALRGHKVTAVDMNACECEKKCQEGWCAGEFSAGGARTSISRKKL